MLISYNKIMFFSYDTVFEIKSLQSYDRKTLATNNASEKINHIHKPK